MAKKNTTVLVGPQLDCFSFGIILPDGTWIDPDYEETVLILDWDRTQPDAKEAAIAYGRRTGRTVDWRMSDVPGSGKLYKEQEIEQNV